MHLRSNLLSFFAVILIQPCLLAQQLDSRHWLQTETDKLRKGAEGPIEALQLRARLLRQLMRDEPGRARQMMIPSDGRARLLQRMPNAAELIESEGRWDGELSSLAIDDFEHGSARFEHFFRIEDRRFRLSSSIPLAPLSCGQEASVTGFRLGDSLLATEVLPSAQAASACTVTGELKTAVILASLPSVPLPSNVTPAFVQAAFFGESGRSVDGFYRDASYGKTRITGNVFGPYVLDSDYPCSDFDSLTNAAMRAADAFVDFRLYNRIIVVSPRSGSCAIGMGTVGCASFSTPGDGSFMASLTFMGADYLTTSDAIVNLASHEMGHNLGLGHANTRDYSDVPLGGVGTSGNDVEYGDIYDVMGLSYSVNGEFVLGHFNAQHKMQLGWLTSGTDYAEVESSGSYLLSPFSAIGGKKAVRVRRGIGINEWLWLEYRQPVGLYDSTLSLYSPSAYAGALVHHERPLDYVGETYLLDYFPAGTPNDFRTAPLTPGIVWNDPYTDLSLQTFASGSNLEVMVTYRPGGCTFILEPSSMIVPAIGGRFWFDVATGALCNFQAAAPDAFVVLDPGSGGTGSKRLYFTVSSNGRTERSATITVGGSTFHLTQEPMSYGVALDPASVTVDAKGGTGAINVTITGESVTWMASSNASWLQPNRGVGGPGSGSLSYAFAPNLGPAPRRAKLRVAGNVVTVTQVGNPDSGAGRLSTIAGLTPAGFGDVPALEASFSSGLWRFDMDAQGNIYLMESSIHRIRKITTDGKVEVLAGNGLPGSTGDGGPARSAKVLEYGDRGGIAVDAAGNVFFTDSGRLRKISTDGIISTARDGIGYPNSMALGPDEAFYFVYSAENRIRKLTPQGQVIPFAGTGDPGAGGDGGNALNAQIEGAFAIAVNASGRVYVSQTGKYNLVRMIDTDGIISTVAGTPTQGSRDEGPATQFKLSYPQGLVFDNSGNLIIVEHTAILWRVSNGMIQRLAGNNGCVTSSPDGTSIATADLAISDWAGFFANGEYVFFDGTRSTFRKVNLQGVLGTYAGGSTSIGDGGPALSAAIQTEMGKLLSDDSGNLYFTDTYNRRVRRISPAGTVSTIAGTGVYRRNLPADGIRAVDTELDCAYAIAFGPTGELYIGEGGLVRKIQADGTMARVFGQYIFGDDGDGGPALLARTGWVESMAFDLQGNLLVGASYASTDGNGVLSDISRVRKISVSGTISAFAGTGQRGESGDGLQAVNAQLWEVHDIAVDPLGNTYLAQGIYSGSLRKVDAGGIISTVLNDHKQPISASGVTTDIEGALYYSNSSGIFRLAPSGKQHVLAQSSASGDSSEGASSLQARLFNPSGLLLDDQGNLLFVEDDAGRIRKITFGFTLSQSELAVDATGGGSSLQVTAPTSESSWIPLSSAAWLQILQSGNRLGDGIVFFTVDENLTTQPRWAVLTIGDQLVLIRQDARVQGDRPARKASPAGMSSRRDRSREPQNSHRDH
jgi:M6 family metalloprotease-like protein